MVIPAGGQDQLERLLAEQIAYYRAIAAEYEDHALDLPGGEELLSVLDAFRREGDVLAIACGPGFWTSELEERLARLGWHATVTATSGPFYWGAGSLRDPPDAVR